MRHAIGWLVAVPAVVIGATVVARVDGVSNTAARESSVFVPLPASAFQTPRQQAADSSRVRALLQAVHTGPPVSDDPSVVHLLTAGTFRTYVRQMT